MLSNFYFFIPGISGGAKRQILKNIDSIVKTALPIEKVSEYYQEVDGAGREQVLDYLVFFQQRKEVSVFAVTLKPQLVLVVVVVIERI